MNDTKTYSSADNSKTGKLNREANADALHHWLFSWGKRWWGASVVEENSPHDYAMVMHSSSVKIAPVLMTNISMEEWHHNTITQLTRALLNALEQKGRAQDMSYITHLHAIQSAGEITIHVLLERLQRLFPNEMLALPTNVRAKLSSIKHEIH